MGTATIAFAMCIASSGSHANIDVLTNSVDLIEINHCYDENGQLVFDQLLFYDWCPSKGRYNVRDWRLLKSAIQVPRRCPDSGLYIAVWRDGPAMRKVHAQTIRESWTQYDPEIIEQEFLPKDKRQALPKFTARRLRVAQHRDQAENQTPEHASQSTAVR